MKDHSPAERILLWVLGCATLLLLLGHMRGWWHEMPSDLRAFYASGRVVMEHQDPYRVQPLFNIEKQLAGPTNPQLYVTPTPLPSYDLLAFAALAHCPVKVATVIYGLVIIAAIFLIAHCLARMSVLPFPVAFAATFFGTAYSAITFGQMLPIVGAGLAYGTLLLRQRKEQAAAIAICTSLIQPQLAVFVIIPCFCFVPKMRLALSLIILGVLATSLTLGLPLMREYLQVIPIQARSEIVFPWQYSLTWLAHYFGLSFSSSLLVGSISTLFCFAFSLGILAYQREAAVKNGAVILLPAALSVFGGTYMHVHHVALALITAITINSAKPSWIRAVPAALLVMMFFETASPMQPWPTKITLLPLLFSIITAWTLAYYLLVNSFKARRIQQASLITIGLTAYLFALIVLRPKFQHLTGITTVPVHFPTMLASEEQLRFNLRYAPMNFLPFYLLVKVPAWIALILTIINAARSLTANDEAQPLSVRAKSHTVSNQYFTTKSILQSNHDAENPSGHF